MQNCVKLTYIDQIGQRVDSKHARDDRSSVRKVHLPMSSRNGDPKSYDGAPNMQYVGLGFIFNVIVKGEIEFVL